MDNFNSVLITFLSLGLIVALVFFVIAQINAARQRIAATITGLDATVVEITFHLFDWDESNYTFTVVFADAAGRKYRTTCKAHFWHDQLFWSASPRELLAANQPPAAPAASPSKEQIIADLQSENDRLQAELARLRQEKGDLGT